MGKFIVGGASSAEIFAALHGAGLIKDDPSFIRRVVIDLKVGSAAVLYTEQFVDDESLKVGIAELMLTPGTDELERA